MIRKLLLACAIFFLAAVPGQFSAAPREAHFVILHTNDLHGHLLPYFVKGKDGKLFKVGGFDNLAAEIERVRERNPVLLLDAGDISQGTPVSNLFFGKPMSESMNLAHYDVSEVGNHEFDWGLKHLEQFIHWCRFPILAANVLERFPGDRWEELPGAKADLLETIQGVKIGIIGVVTPTTPFISKPDNMKNLRFLEPAPVVEKYIPILRSRGAEIIIVLSHLGVEDDEALARAVPGIDLIVGGHSHTVLEKAIMVGHTMIVQTGCYCRYLGEIKVSMMNGSPHFRYHLIPIYPGEIKPDSRIFLIMQRYQTKLAPLMNRMICVLKNDLIRDSRGESSMGDVISDALRNATGAQVAFQNAGGIRGDLLEGKVLWGDLFTVLPFDDDAVTMDLKGKDILSILRHAVSGHIGLIQVSGLKYEVSEGGEGDDSPGVLQGAWIDGKPVNPDETYRVATSDFLSTGGDGYEAFKSGANVKHGRVLLNIVIDYLKPRSPFSFHIDGRIVVHEAAKVPG